MQKKFSFKNNPLAKTIVFSGAVLIIIAFVILRYEGFFAAVSKLLKVFRPIIIGCVIAFALNRPLNFFHRKYRGLFFSIRRKAFAKSKKNSIRKNYKSSGHAAFICSCITVYLLMIAVITAIICFVVPQLANSVTLFSNNFQTYADNLLNFVKSNKLKFDGMLNTIDLNSVMNKIQEMLMKLPEYIPDLLSKTFDITSGIIGVTVDLFLGIVFSVYILADKRSLKKHAGTISRSILKDKYAHFEKIIALSYRSFSNFITGQIIEAFILGMLCFIGMTVFGFEYAALISVIMGSVNMIPIVGPIIGTIPGALILLMIDPIKAVWFVVFIIVIQQIDSNIIYPKVVGNSIGLPGLWVLVAITVGGGLGGILGMILGVPLASILFAIVSDKLKQNEKQRKENSKENKVE